MSKTRPPKRVSQSSLENAALHYLERFSASAESLRRVLMRRVTRAAAVHGDDPAEGADLVEALILRYQQAGLLDDRLYAEARSQSLLRRGTPLMSIRRALCQKGVETDLVDAVLGEMREDFTERGVDADLAAASAYAKRRRLGPHRSPDKRALHRDRDLASMGRAGFSWEMARKVIDDGGED